MKRLLFLLLLVSQIAFGQKVFTYGGKAVTYGGKVLTVTPSAYCPEYQAVYDAYTTKPSDAVAAIDNTMVVGLVSDGVWVKLDVVWVYASHTNGAGEALINWKLPGTYDATAYNAPTFTAYEGFLGNGTTQYIDCNWVPSVSAVNLSLNSASLIIYIRTNVGNDTYHGVSGTNRLYLLPRSSANIAYHQILGAQGSAANLDGSGMYVVSRTAAAVDKTYRNKAVLINATNAVTYALPAYSPYSLALNNNGVATGFRADQVSLYAFGAGLTQTDVNNITDYYNNAMRILGKNVF